MEEYILSVDQGTTSSRAILFRKDGSIFKSHRIEFTQYFPRPGWVEHDPKEILSTVITCIKEVVKDVDPSTIKAMGITNQRETTVVWDRYTGEPVYNAIVWQSRQSQGICDYLIEQGKSDFIWERTGLLINPYFSASKIRFILDYCKIEDTSHLMAGTIDSWLIYNLTKEHHHLTDYTNASRTLLYNIYELKWDDALCNLFGIDSHMLPTVQDSCSLFGYTDKEVIGIEIPITGVAGDQQASLFGQTCFNKGDTKNTYGTGCFMLMNTQQPIKTKSGLLTTIAWGLNGQVTYALEGSIFIGGSVMQWLRDQLKLFKDVKVSESMAESLVDNEGVYLVPAFVGLGTPYWDNDVRGTILGLTRGTTDAHIVRAALESIAYQTKDIIETIEKDADIHLHSFYVDGGATHNNFLMQFQSDLLNTEIQRPEIVETTALGAAYLAGLGVNFYKNIEEIKENHKISATYKPSMSEERRRLYYNGWKKAIEATRVFKNIETDEF